MNMIIKFTVPGILFVLTLVFGFWLSKDGKPYNGILFNIHKLIALAGVIFAGLQLYNLLRGGQIPALLVIALVAAALCIVALFFSGAMMSTGQLNQVVMLTIHRITIAVEVISLAVMLYLFNGIKP